MNCGPFYYFFNIYYFETKKLFQKCKIFCCLFEWFNLKRIYFLSLLCVVGSLPVEGKWQHNPIVQMVSILNHIKSIIAIYFMIARLTFITRALNEVMSNTRRWNYDTSLNGVHSRYSIPIHERAHDFIKSPGNWSHHYKVSGN